MLRLRRVQDVERQVWVATMQSVGSGEERSFLSIEALAAFLLGEYAECGKGEGRREANSSAEQE
jgi:hypothetical protein